MENQRNDLPDTQLSLNIKLYDLKDCETECMSCLVQVMNHFNDDLTPLAKARVAEWLMRRYLP